MGMSVMKRLQPLVDSTNLLREPGALREQAREDGYLYFRGLLPRQELLDLRRKILELAHEAGWLQEGRPVMEGIAKPGTFVMEFSGKCPEWRVFYRKLQSLREFHALAHRAEILQVLQAVLGGEILVQPRNMSRIMFPGDTTYTTPPHQDHIHIRGTPDVWTCWFPAGDCPTELGGLAVLPGSNRTGLLKTRPMAGAGGTGVDVAEDAVWVGGDMQAGDVLFFHSLTVHQGRDNRTADRVRLSCDYRYQRADEAIDEDSLEPHGGVVTWPDAYATWNTDPATDPLRFYWKKFDLKVQEHKGGKY
ncbi:MAG: phytanoyl-CoA dioxygenase family protein [Planctomycetota bacterium]